MKFNYTLFLTTIISITLSKASSSFTEKLFYDAVFLPKTNEFCKTITANNFYNAIKSEKAEETKTTAFKFLFDCCGYLFLEDAIMAKSIIIHMVDSGNTKYLPIFLNQGTIAIEGKPNETYDKSIPDTLKIKYNNIDLTQEFIEIFEHLYTANTSKTDFESRLPHQALDYILAYTDVDTKLVETAKERLGKLNNLVPNNNLIDSASLSLSMKIIERYLKSPELIGNHKPQAAETEKYEPINTSTSPTLKLTESGDFIVVGIVILAIGSIIAVVLGLLWKLKA